MKRSKRFGMVISQKEHETILKMAELEGGLSMAALVRRIIRNSAKERGVWPQSNKDELIINQPQTIHKDEKE